MKLYLPIFESAVFFALLIFGMHGWGALLESRLLRHRSYFGLQITLGFSLLTFLVFVFTSILPFPLTYFYWVYLITGLLLSFCARPLKLVHGGCENGIAKALVVIAILLAGLLCLSSIGIHEFNVNDDGIAYFPYAKKLLQTGSLIEPFSLRRLASYGGQTIAHSLCLIFFSPKQLSVWDHGLVPLLFLLVLLGFPVEGKKTKYIWPALAFLMSVYDYSRINTAPQSAGVWMIASILLFLKLEKNECPNNNKAMFLLFLLLVSFASLRAHFVMWSGLFLGVYYWIHRKELNRKATSVQMLMLAVLSAPLVAALFESSHSPLFPPFHGNYDQTFGTFWFQSVKSSLGSRAISFLSEGGVQSLLSLGVLFLFLLWNDLGFRAVFIASIATFIAFAFLSGQILFVDVIRYCEGLILAPLMLGLGKILDDFFTQRINSPRPGRLHGKWLPISAICIMTFFVIAGLPVFKEIRERDFLHGFPSNSGEEELKLLMALIPRGSNVVAAIEDPVFLDFTQHSIFLLDIPGNVSPVKPLRFSRAKETLRLLRESGMDWMLLENPLSVSTSCIYSQKFWKHINWKKVADYRINWNPRFQEYFDFFHLISKGASVGTLTSRRYLAIDIPKALQAMER